MLKNISPFKSAIAGAMALSVVACGGGSAVGGCAAGKFRNGDDGDGDDENHDDDDSDDDNDGNDDIFPAWWAEARLRDASRLRHQRRNLVHPRNVYSALPQQLHAQAVTLSAGLRDQGHALANPRVHC